MQEYVTVLPPPYPPIPVRAWRDAVPRMRCPFCGTVFSVREGTVSCPKCGRSFIVARIDWQSFALGVLVGFIIGVVVTAAIFYFVILPRIPLHVLILQRLAAWLPEWARR